MRRRTFLAVSAGTAGALAGCATLGGDGGDDSGPTDPIESFVQGYAANDSEAAQAAVHPDGPLADDLPRSVDDRQLELANATVVSESNGTAVVEANVSVRGGTVQWHEPRTFEVREVEGDWRVWSMTTGPEIAFGAFFEALEAGRTDDAADRLHPESPTREWFDATVLEHAAPSLESASLAAFWDDEATMDVVFTEAVGEETVERSRQIELRRTGAGWRVWSLRFGPVVPVYRYARAITENDVELFERALHPDGPDSDVDEDALSFIQAASVQEVAVEEIADGEATLLTTIEMEAFGETLAQEIRFTVAPHEGEWRLLESETLS